MSEYGFDPIPQPALPPTIEEPIAASPSVPSPKRRSRRGLWVPVLSGFIGAVLAVGGLQAVEAIQDDTTTSAPSTSDSAVPVSNEDGSSVVQIPAMTTSAVDAAEVGATVIPSIVAVEVGGQNPMGFVAQGSGSGVILDAAGHIVTNNHVAEIGGALQVVLSDGRVYPAELVGTDPLTDLAVLRITADDLTPIELGNTGTLRVGDPAVAVGSPLGLEGGPSLTVGVVSAFDRRIQTGSSAVELFGMIQTDAPITQGSSGGALVDSAGRLIGITTAVGVSSIGVEGVGFATPVEIVSGVADEIIATGSATHAYLGITGGTEMAPLDGGGSIPAGVRVESVEPNSAAATIGIEVGDLITAVDGKSIDTMEELVALLRRYQAGETASLTVSGASGEATVEVMLGAYPS